MAFLVANAMKFNNAQSVDTAFSPILEKNLFKDTTFVNGVTFTDKHQVNPAGQIIVRKPGKPSVKNVDPTSATAATLDFAHTQTADTLISIEVSKTISASEKVYRAVNDARAVETPDLEAMELAVDTVTENFQVAAMAGLVAGAKASTKTAASTAATIIENILTDRKAIRDAGGMADVIVVSTRIYTMLLQELSGKDFLPVRNESVLASGIVGTIYGMAVYESNLLTDTGVATNTEYVIYDHDTYSIIAPTVAARTIPAIDFLGVYAQCQVVAGFKVTNADLAIRHTIAS